MTSCSVTNREHNQHHFFLRQNIIILHSTPWISFLLKTEHNHAPLHSMNIIFSAWRTYSYSSPFHEYQLFLMQNIIILHTTPCISLLLDAGHNHTPLHSTPKFHFFLMQNIIILHSSLWISLILSAEHNHTPLNSKISFLLNAEHNNIPLHSKNITSS